MSKEEKLWRCCGKEKKTRKNWRRTEKAKRDVFDKTDGECCHCSRKFKFEDNWEVEHWTELSFCPGHEDEYDVFTNIFPSHKECNGHNKVLHLHLDLPRSFSFLKG